MVSEIQRVEQGFTIPPWRLRFISALIVVVLAGLLPVSLGVAVAITTNTAANASGSGQPEPGSQAAGVDDVFVMVHRPVVLMANANRSFADELERRQAAEAEQAEQAAEAQRIALGLPPDSYWDRMAACETGGNWAMTGPRYSGGVGFANTTWVAYGGREFAPDAGHATRDQQIVVANRVATQGHGSVRAVGYSAWGCTKRVGYP